MPDNDNEIPLGDTPQDVASVTLSASAPPTVGENLTNTLRHLNALINIDIGLALPSMDIGELGLAHHELTQISHAVLATRKSIDSRIKILREERLLSLPEETPANDNLVRYQELRDELFKSWVGNEPPLLTRTNILAGMQYCLPPRMGQLLSEWFGTKLTKDITIQSVVYDKQHGLTSGDLMRVLSFRLSMNTQKGLKTSMCVWNAPSLFKALHEIEQMEKHTVAEDCADEDLPEVTVDLSFDKSKPTKRLTVRKRKPTKKSAKVAAKQVKDEKAAADLLEKYTF